MAYFSELRRRKVFRAAAVYAAGAFVVLQAADLAVGPLRLPPWTMTLLWVLVLAAFPLAMILAWAYDVTGGGLERTQDPEPAAARNGRRRAGLGAAALAVAVLAVAGAVGLRLGGDPPPDVATALPVLDSLIAERRYAEAFDLAIRVDVGAADTALARVWPEIADVLTVTTGPPGAAVSVWRHEGSAEAGPHDARWIPLGRTPLRGLRIPRTDHVLRVELDGYAPVSRLVSSSLARSRSLTSSPELDVEIPLVPADRAPADMVLVPGGPYELASLDLPRGLVTVLHDFFLDAFEVTNADFAAFIAAGGYADPTHWRPELLDDAGAPSFRAAVRPLVDATGLPGPRGWSGQRFPPGRERHPVTGVTWHEAAAYCAWRGKRLPGLFEWESAARAGRIVHSDGYALPWGVARDAAGPGRANFGGSGTVAVDALPFGMSPYGAYAMAGNVKEWVASATERGRAATGGSWEDPPYLFSEVAAYDPLHAAPGLGFRCARPAGEVLPAGPAARPGSAPDPYAERIAIDPPVPSYEPVGDAAFAAFLGHYRYDRRPLDAEVTDRARTDAWTRERITFTGPAGDDVVAYLYLPRHASPPYQTIVLVPGSNAFFADHVTTIAERLLGPVIRSGRALLVPVLEGMLERPFAHGQALPDPPSIAFRDLMVRHATELRYGIDYLETRPEVDTAALAYTGLSFGAGSRLPLAATDDRFDAFILIGGGIDERMQPTLPEASNINFAPRIPGPTLLVNGQHDEEHPWLTRGQPLWNLLREPKRLVLVEGAGHLPPPEALIPAITGFLEDVLGPVR